MSYEEALAEVEAAGSWAKHFVQASRALTESVLRPYGLGSTQWFVLHLLAEGGPAEQRELATMLDVERATISGVVSVLVDKGLLEQHTARADGRQRVLHLTDRGYQLWQKAPNPLSVIKEIALSGFEPREVETMNRLLRDATRRLQSHHANTWPTADDSASVHTQAP